MLPGDTPDGGRRQQIACDSSRTHAASSAASAARLRATFAQGWPHLVGRMMRGLAAPTAASPATSVRWLRTTTQRLHVAAGHGRPPCAASAHGVARAWLRPVSRGNRHFTVGGGRLRQSGPRPEGRLLRQPALEGLTRSARTETPRKVGRNKFWREGRRHGDARRRRRRLY
ncbi:hypothetical protein F511_16983 [Dorcoceras hygrometricum]|uniref:Uncharacterized protein n=1 Tax=Dorcoceras hygrometricum TaxID=472368 RepID=A0A2Z7A7Q3_9LAMI|nr:hypothetical protein F511_16983 [Dorcoceras hygrometricum]